MSRVQGLPELPAGYWHLFGFFAIEFDFSSEVWSGRACKITPSVDRICWMTGGSIGRAAAA
jgi:hypothetical protein